MLKLQRVYIKFALRLEEIYRLTVPGWSPNYGRWEGGGGVLSVPQTGEFRHISSYEPELRFRIDLNLAPKGFGSEISQISCSRAGIETCLQTVELN